MQKSKWRECKPTYAEKLLSQWEKVGFIAILRVKLEYMKDGPFSWNEVLELQCTESLVLSF